MLPKLRFKVKYEIRCHSSDLYTSQVASFTAPVDNKKMSRKVTRNQSQQDKMTSNDCRSLGKMTIIKRSLTVCSAPLRVLENESRYGIYVIFFFFKRTRILIQTGLICYLPKLTKILAPTAVTIQKFSQLIYIPQTAVQINAVQSIFLLSTIIYETGLDSQKLVLWINTQLTCSIQYT